VHSHPSYTRSINRRMIFHAVESVNRRITV
jgi:hypothetical protein